MKLVKRGGTWQVHFTDSAGDRQRTSTGVKVNPRLPDEGKAEATLAALDKMRTNLLSSDIPDGVRKRAGQQRTLAYALNRTFEERWRKQKSANQRSYMLAVLTQEVGYWPLNSITYLRLQDYGVELEKRGLKPATLNRRMSCIQTCLTDAMKRGELDSLPQFPHWREDNIKERYLTKEEEAHLLTVMAETVAQADEPRQYVRHMTEFLLDTGMRASEATQLTPIQDRGDKVWLPHGSTKSGKGRSVPLTTRARAALDYILASPTHAEAVKHGAVWASQFLGRRFQTLVDRAGIEGVTLHTLRHTCASRLVQAGVDIYVVQKWLGHSTIVTTERYAHLATENLEGAMRALEPATLAQPAQPTPRAGTVH